MFNGLIRHIGEVVGVAEGELRVRCAGFGAAVPNEVGASIAVSGVCLTVVESAGDEVRFDVAAETRRVTTLGEKKIGDSVHIEAPLRYGDAVDGHLLQGHVDAVVEVLAINRQDAQSVEFSFSYDAALAPYLAAKGAVALDGVSLTVVAVDKTSFSVCIIPHTLSETTFGSLAVGSRLNIEVDCLARYVQRAVLPYIKIKGGE